MKKLAFWLIGVALLGGALTLVAVRTGVINDYQEATLFLAGVAAVGAVAGAVIPLLGNRTTSHHLRELTEQQEQAGSDIRRLAELTESSLEEARAQKPDPILWFIVGKEREAVGGAIVTRKRLSRTLDIEKIVADERQAALATLPPELEPEDETAERVLGLGGLSSVVRAAISGFESGPMTAQERALFERRVDDYASELRKWLRSYVDYRDQTDLAIALLLRFENRGRVPAEGLHVHLRFPDGFEEAEDRPRLGNPPRRPRFQRRRFGAPSLARALMTDYPRALLDPGLIPGPRNVSSPRYRKGSLLVELNVKKLLHGLSEDADDPIWVTVEADGEYGIPWEIHAENLAEPARGQLVLQVVTEVQEGPPVASLAELQDLDVRGGEENDSEG